MDVKTLKEVRDIVEGSGVEIPAESSGDYRGDDEDLMDGIILGTLQLSG